MVLLPPNDAKVVVVDDDVLLLVSNSRNAAMREVAEDGRSRSLLVEFDDELWLLLL